MNKIDLIVLLICIYLTVGKQNITNVKDIESSCYSYLEKNVVKGEKWGTNYQFYKPSTTKYSNSQWLWDSGAHMITWSHKNVTNSKIDLETMLSMQRPDGFIPEIIFWGNQGIKGSLVNKLYFGNNKYATITQTPVITFSLQRIYENTQDKTFLKKNIYPVFRYLEWWVETRDPTNSGLVSIIHGWESGMDASPAYDEAYFNKNTQPKHLDLYSKFVELLLAYNIKYNWNMTKIMNRQTGKNNLLDDYFFVQDTMINSVLAAGYRLLSNLALEINDEGLSRKCKQRQLVIEKAILKELYVPELGRFASANYRDTDGKYVHARAECVQSLFPLLLETLPNNIKKQIITTQLTNTSKFWTLYPLPSVSMTDPAFQPSFVEKLLWRGPTWPIMNYFIVEGLIFQKEDQVAKELVSKWINVYIKSGVWEHYNPLNGLPYGQEGLGMSTLIVDSMYRLGFLKKL